MLTIEVNKWYNNRSSSKLKHSFCIPRRIGSLKSGRERGSLGSRDACGGRNRQHVRWSWWILKICPIVYSAVLNLNHSFAPDASHQSWGIPLHTKDRPYSEKHASSHHPPVIIGITVSVSSVMRRSKLRQSHSMVSFIECLQLSDSLSTRMGQKVRKVLETWERLWQIRMRLFEVATWRETRHRTSSAKRYKCLIEMALSIVYCAVALSWFLSSKDEDRGSASRKWRQYAI